ncbi:hypothetical protein D3C83_37820 [compost metagenome]
MGSILPAHVLPVDQPQVGLVDQGGRLQDVPGTLPGHVATGQAVQLRLDDGRQRLEGAAVPVVPGSEQLGHVGVGIGHDCGRLA